MIQKIHHQTRTVFFKNNTEDWHYLVQVLFLLLLVGFPMYGSFFPFPVLAFDVLFIAFILYSFILLEKPNTPIVITGIIVILILLIKTSKINFQSLQISFWIERLELIFLIIYFIQIGFRLLMDTISEKVSKKLLYISIANYFIIGILFGCVFELIHLYNIHAFNFTREIKYDYLYMSFITLSSVGLGDMLPISTAAKSAVVLDSIAGQLYLTFFVAIIIGKYLAEHVKRKE